LVLQGVAVLLAGSRGPVPLSSDVEAERMLAGDVSPATTAIEYRAIREVIV